MKAVKSKFRKSSTPPSRKNASYSPSSGEESSGDDFPLFRPNFLEKSPKSPRVLTDQFDLEKGVREIDELLRLVRQKLRKLL
jgi:hypothetical protein